MALPLIVDQSPGPAASDPVATVSMDLLEFGFNLSAPITGGTQVIEATNTGAQDHEFWWCSWNQGQRSKNYLKRWNLVRARRWVYF